MNLIGTPDKWVGLIDDMVPDILELVITTWEEMPPLESDALEDPTTEELCRCLRQNRNSANLPFRIDIQQVELDPTAGQGQGRMDIVFSPMVPSEDIYFCLECKRLNVITNGKVRAYSNEYVTQGMLRFIRGQYASKVRHGGMLGYVLDGNVSQAIANVRRAIQNNYQALGMTPQDFAMLSPGEMRSSSVRPSDSSVRETQHTRQKMPRLTIHHIFVSRHTISLIKAI